MAVAEKVTGASPSTVAVTVLVPASLPSISRVAARPLSSVVAVAADSVPPPAVTENDTGTSARGAPAGSSTETTNGSASCTLAVPSWLSPETFVRL